MTRKISHSLRARRARARKILALLDEHYPNPRCALDHRTPFQLLVATILSAQCTDKRVNMVTPELFARYPTVSALARARQEDVEEIIKSTGFFRNKAKNIIGAAQTLQREFGGEVPGDMERLLRLPGVARKTANVVLGECFGKAEGIVVDTHVARLSRLLGLTESTDPKRIEKDLMEVVPKDHWIRFAHQLIQHGRSVCIARRPRCDECFLAGVCPSRIR